MDELAGLDLSAQATLVKTGQVTAEELLEGPYAGLRR